MSDYRAIDDRKARVPASRVGYHKQTKSKKTMFTAASVAHRDLSKCSNWANCALMAQSRGLYA